MPVFGYTDNNYRYKHTVGSKGYSEFILVSSTFVSAFVIEGPKI